MAYFDVRTGHSLLGSYDVSPLISNRFGLTSPYNRSMGAMGETDVNVQAVAESLIKKILDIPLPFPFNKVISKLGNLIPDAIERVLVAIASTAIAAKVKSSMNLKEEASASSIATYLAEQVVSGLRNQIMKFGNISESTASQIKSANIIESEGWNLVSKDVWTVGIAIIDNPVGKSIIDIKQKIQGIFKDILLNLGKATGAPTHDDTGDVIPVGPGTTDPYAIAFTADELVKVENYFINKFNSDPNNFEKWVLYGPTLNANTKGTGLGREPYKSMEEYYTKCAEMDKLIPQNTEYKGIGVYKAAGDNWDQAMRKWVPRNSYAVFQIETLRKKMALGLETKDQIMARLFGAGGAGAGPVDTGIDTGSFPIIPVGIAVVAALILLK